MRPASRRFSPKELDLLALLVRNTDRVLTHRAILKAIWGPSAEDEQEHLWVLIGHRSNATVEGAFLFTRKLSARGLVSWQHTHGGLNRLGAPGLGDLAPPGEVNSPERP